MHPATAKLFGLQALLRATSDHYVEWATDLLVAGRDSPNLRILAGLEPPHSHFEVEEHYRRALRELEIVEPDEAGKLRAYGVELARRTLDGRLTPEAGVRALARIASELAYEGPFGIWLELDEALDDLWSASRSRIDPTATPESFADRVKIESEKFLAAMIREPGD